MGFFTRLIKGEPAFQPPSDNSNNQSTPNQSESEPLSVESPPLTSQPGPKIIPVVQVERVELPRNEASRLQVVVALKNTSQVPVRLDEMRLLNTTKKLNEDLGPGESREFTVYDGQRPNNQNNDNAQVDFKDMSGDYFRAFHTVYFRQEPDNTYSVLRFQFNGPVKDI